MPFIHNSLHCSGLCSFSDGILSQIIALTLWECLVINQSDDRRIMTISLVMIMTGTRTSIPLVSIRIHAGGDEDDNDGDN